MNWREKIEAQIADLRCGVDEYDLTLGEKAANTLQALLDVAVAAERLPILTHIPECGCSNCEAAPAFFEAFGKLREVE